MNLQMMQILGPAAFLYTEYGREEVMERQDEKIYFETEGCI